MTVVGREQCRGAMGTVHVEPDTLIPTELADRT
jgi:hypothetical protein